ncbi:MAG: response regulator transcription factor, partial [Gammaproteobacteria bacterium]
MAPALKILIADDDADLRAALAEQLALHEEFVAVQTDTAQGALNMVREQTPDLVIMDVGLPDADGRVAVRQMRQEGFKNPVIMLTAHGSETDTVEGFDAGANDYVTKPFRFAELLARIRAHLRQRESNEEALFRIGPYTFQPGAKHLIGEKGNKLRLTEKETAILRFLYRAGQGVI